MAHAISRASPGDDIPSFKHFIKPAFDALRQLGGSGTIKEIDEKATALAEIPVHLLDIPHVEEDGAQHGTEVGYKLFWARTYLKKDGYITNSQRGVWTLTDLGRTTTEIDPDVIVSRVRKANRKLTKKSEATVGRIVSGPEPEPSEEIEERWKSDLIDALVTMKPDGFERLAQRILREAGFEEVEVTGRSGDGGIDGHGRLRLGLVLSVKALFQCKRYTHTVPARDVREFVGALTNAKIKQGIFSGVFMATSTFSRGAQDEAKALDIQLIDIDDLIDLLKSLEIGVKKVVKEVYEVDRHLFNSI